MAVADDVEPDLAAGDRLVGADRVLAVLIALAGRPEGATLDDLSRQVASPKPTVHRALASLSRAGLASKQGVGHYALGDEFLRLAFAHHAVRPDHLRVLPALQELAERFGETAHYAVLDEGEVVYRAKVDPPFGAVRLTSTIGGRNPAHCTGVGKLLLAHHLSDEASVRRWVQRHALTRRTEKTITTTKALWAELQQIRERGYAVDDQENEVGINCVAVPVRLGPTAAVDGAISVSALVYRTPLDALEREVDTIQKMATGNPST